MPSIFRNGILGFIPQRDWLSVNFSPRRQNDPTDVIFGDEKTENIEASWQSIQDEYMIPVMAMFHAFDVEAQKTFRIPVDTHSVEKGLIKVKSNVSELLAKLKKNGVQGDQAIYDYVFDDGLRLADQVVTRTKVAKNELLATGKVTIKENNLDITVDYNVPDANLNKTLDFGSGADKSIPDQFQDLIDETAEKGITLDGMMLSQKNLTRMRQDAAVQKAINGVYMTGQLVSNNAIRAWLSEEYGINKVIVNDQSYNTAGAMNEDTGIPTLTRHRYFPANKISFFATNNAGHVGTALWGDPPETEVQDAPEVAVETSGVSPYIYLTQWREGFDPCITWTKASTLFIPVLYNPNALYVASVIMTPGA